MALANRKIGYDEVVTRDLHFPMNLETVARHWFNNDPWSTHWMNAILAAVPDGERWVMNSARRQLDKLRDPEVRKMWRWHATEELEHKGVAYDTWNHATRGWTPYRRWKVRSLMMLVVTGRFFRNRWEDSMNLLAQDGITEV